MRESAWIGIDVGGTKTRLDLFNDDLEKIGDIKFKTPGARKQFAVQLTHSLRQFVNEAVGRRLRISGIGIGAAASINPRKETIKSAANLPFLAGFSFKDALRPVCQCPVVLLNDIQAALYGELKVGNAVGYKDVIAIFIGTGIGGAVAVDGELYLGSSREAGNIGHYLLNAFGPLAGSERDGVLDDVASRLGMAGTAATLAAKQWAPHMGKWIGTDVKQIKSSAFAKAIGAGDRVIEELVRSRFRIIGIVLSNIVDFFSPEMIVLGGGLTDALPKIARDEVQAGIEAHGTRAAVKGLKVVTAKHKGHAVTIGAARFVVDLSKRRQHQNRGAARAA